jgi:hypothetical protein
MARQNQVMINRFIILLISFICLMLIFHSHLKTKYQLSFTGFLHKEIDGLERSNMQDSSIFFRSTCSFKADQRGHHQRIIAYSLYGNLSSVDFIQKYFKPLNNTIASIPFIYPGNTVNYNFFQKPLVKVKFQVGLLEFIITLQLTVIK